MDSLKQLLYRYNPWWTGEFLMKGIILRKAIFQKLLDVYPSKDIILLTGLRRIGKTTLMRLLIQYIIETKKLAPERIFYISMDEYSLRGQSLGQIIDEYRAIHRLRSSDETLLFLDEITALPEYEIQLKNLYDMGGIKVYASSSSASILRRGQAYITGRKRVIEVPPLDFEEYLEFKNINVSPLDLHLQRGYFEDFMKSGGIPEFVLTGDIAYLHQLVDDIICKDIAAVHGIKQLGVLKDFFMLLMERAGKSVSINKMARILEIAPDTAKRYLRLFEETFLIHLISRHGKLNEQLRAPKKLYAADLGIRVLFTGYRDIGSLFENYVYLKIAHRQPQFFIKDGIEIDFITADSCLIEVKYDAKLRAKQQRVFDEYEASRKLVIGSVEDLQEFDKVTPELDYQVRAGVESYVTASSKVNLGRSPGMELKPNQNLFGADYQYI
jgi:predicted AAA+ superfamily ATPase